MTAAPPTAALTHRPWKRALLALSLLAAMALLAFLFRAPLLTGLARAWVVNDPLTKADAIVVLGGRPDLRAVEAARLYHAGLAPRILYMDVLLSPSAELGIVLSEREQTRRLLLSNNVPENAITAIGQAVASTFDESRAVRAWAGTNRVTSLIIPTDLFHTRRVRWLFRKQLRESAADLQMDAITPKEYAVTNWWRHEEGMIAFQNEAVKSMFYRLKY